MALTRNIFNHRFTRASNRAGGGRLVVLAAALSLVLWLAIAAAVWRLIG